MRVLAVASEAFPLVKTGGLADVAGALPVALGHFGVETTTLIPGYPQVMARAHESGTTQAVWTWSDFYGGWAELIGAEVAGLKLLILNAPHLFNRDGGIYGNGAVDWPDNWRRFAALGRAAADLAGGGIKGQGFDLLHAHDWQAALGPAYLRFAPPVAGRAVPSVTTIHNIAFQGRFDRSVFPQLGLPQAAWAIDGVEYHGGVGFLKAGLEAASAITTVSPTYAAEIREAGFGMGLEGLIVSREARVHGILNGIDAAEWNPAGDPHLPARYSLRSLARRAANKRALEAEFGLEEEAGPLFVVVSRLTWQKGMDVLLAVLDGMVEAGGRLALLGSGDPALEAGFAAAAARHPGRVGVRIGYDEALSHRLQGGGDAILIPSRFEPCGLTQLYGLAYGCVPVVARTGGLADTVIDANPAALGAGVATGIQFDGVEAETLARAIARTVALFRRPDEWLRLQKNGMRCDFSWARSGRTYAELYSALVEEQP